MGETKQLLIPTTTLRENQYHQNERASSTAHLHPTNVFLNLISSHHNLILNRRHARSVILSSSQPALMSRLLSSLRALYESATRVTTGIDFLIDFVAVLVLALGVETADVASFLSSFRALDKGTVWVATWWVGGGIIVRVAGRGLSALGGDGFDFFGWAVGEVAWVAGGVVVSGHLDGPTGKIMNWWMKLGYLVL